MRRAFTLVELLVVIGIIAVLISILLPSLGRARRSAQAVQCRNNLRQVAIAMLMYAGDNAGMLPNYGYTDATNLIIPYDPSTTTTDPYNPNPGLWGEALHRYLTGPFRNAAAGTDANYYLGATFLRCPSEQPFSSGAYSYWTYGVNFGSVSSTEKPGIFWYYSIGHVNANYNGTRKLVNVKPTEFLLCDVKFGYLATAPPYCYNNKYQTPNTDTDNDGLFDSNSTTLTAKAPYGQYNFAAFRHEGWMNYACADASVQTTRVKEWFSAGNPAWYTQ